MSNYNYQIIGMVTNVADVFVNQMLASFSLDFANGLQAGDIQATVPVGPPGQAATHKILCMTVQDFQRAYAYAIAGSLTPANALADQTRKTRATAIYYACTGNSSALESLFTQIPPGALQTAWKTALRSVAQQRFGTTTVAQNVTIIDVPQGAKPPAVLAADGYEMKATT